MLSDEPTYQVHHMPTTKPRITITLDEDTYALLSTFSKLSGRSQSAIASELLSSANPALSMGVKAFQVLSSATPAAKDLIRRQSETLELSSESHLQAFLGSINALGHAIDAAQPGGPFSLTPVSTAEHDGNGLAIGSAVLSKAYEPPLVNKGVASTTEPLTASPESAHLCQIETSKPLSKHSGKVLYMGGRKRAPKA